MKLSELVKAAKTANPKIFAKMKDQKAVRIAQAYLREIARSVRSAAEGKLDVEGLGRFVVRPPKPESEGAKKGKKRVAFRPAGQKGKKGQKAKKGKKGKAKGAQAKAAPAKAAPAKAEA